MVALFAGADVNVSIPLVLIVQGPGELPVTATPFTYTAANGVEIGGLDEAVMPLMSKMGRTAPPWLA